MAVFHRPWGSVRLVDMMPAERFKPYTPNMHAEVRLAEALPPDHPVHAFVDLVAGRPRSLRDSSGTQERNAVPPARAVRGIDLELPARRAFLAPAGSSGPAGGGLRLPGRAWPAELPDLGALPARERGVHGCLAGAVVRALRLGLVRLGHVALDGATIKANISKHKAMSYGQVRQREEVKS